MRSVCFRYVLELTPHHFYSTSRGGTLRMLMDLKAALAEVIACGRTNRETLAGAADCIRHTCGSRWVGLYRLDPARSLVENVVFTGGPAPAYPTFALDKGLTGLAVARKKTVLV